MQTPDPVHPSAPRALVLGATGGIGGEVARQLRDAGWQVVALRRRQATAEAFEDGIDWRRGDAMQAADVAGAARGCQVIVHAVNPPGYRRWAELVLPMIDHSIAAARAAGATLVLPGTVYNYGPDALPVLTEDLPQRPRTRKGAIRVELEARLEAASRTGVRVLVLRAGDFFGPRPGGNWFSQGMIRPGRAVGTIWLPGTPGIGHQWSFLPDVARTMVRLLARRDELPAFARFHLAGHWDADGTHLARVVADVARRHGQSPTTRRLPWWLLRLLSPFVPTLKEMMEMRYLWQQPVRMDNARLVAFLGSEPHTPWETAVEATLQGLGCLPAPRATAPAA